MEYLEKKKTQVRPIFGIAAWDQEESSQIKIQDTNC